MNFSSPRRRSPMETIAKKENMRKKTAKPRIRTERHAHHENENAREAKVWKSCVRRTDRRTVPKIILTKIVEKRILQNAKEAEIVPLSAIANDRQKPNAMHIVRAKNEKYQVNEVNHDYSNNLSYFLMQNLNIQRCQLF